MMLSNAAKLHFISITILLATALSACSPSSTTTANSNNSGSGGTGGGTGTVTLIHFNDLHAHLTPHLDRVAVAATSGVAATTKLVERGGLARAATLIKQIRNSNPNSILMNIGDTYHGGVEALFSLGNDIVDPVNALKVDVGVPGNWDFAFGPNVTRLRYAALTQLESSALQSALTQATKNQITQVKRPNFPNLAANVTYAANVPLGKAGQPFLPPTWTTVKGNIKIGFIGITSDIVPRMSKVLAEGLDFMQGEANYKNLINQQAQSLRNGGAQLVFVMSELGIHRDKQLADIINKDSVDVFFSAHTHEATFTPLTSTSGALVVEAGNDGYIGRMDATVSKSAKPTFVWNLLTLDQSIAEDGTVKALVTTARTPYVANNPNIKFPLPYANVTLTQPITTVVGKTNTSIDRRQALENTFNRVFTDTLRTRTGTDLAMTPGFRFDSVVGDGTELLEDMTYAKGEITLEDVYRFFPVIYTISTGKIAGDKLKENLEQGLSNVFSKNAFSQGGGWFEGYAGINLTVDITQADGARIVSAKNPDNVIDFDFTATASYTVTGCSRPFDNILNPGELCSYPNFTDITDVTNPATASAFTVQEMFIDLMAPPIGQTNFTPLLKGTNHHTETSNTPVWPNSPFVQPMW